MVQETSKVLEGHHLAGHLGNLTPEQEQAFATFKENLTAAGLYTPATEDTKASHEDTTVLRFLRARSFNLAAAQKQFAEAEAWRKKLDVTKLYEDLSPDDMTHSQRFYPRWTGRRDKLGVPLFVYRLASLEPIQHELDAIPAQTRYHRIVALYEFMTRFTFPLCSHIPHAAAPTPISSTMTIIDLEKVSFGSMWRLRHHLQEASRLSTANYPETLHAIAVVNSPSFFPTIWNWIKGWFDEGTRQKIHVLGKDPGSTLLELVHAHDLPAAYGGELEWKFEDDPHLDSDTKEVVGDAIPKGPVAFVDGAVVQLPTTKAT
ncbi:CRAL/TRIO domain-containing protein [Pholiota conissans]|uniref:CRAL/TRIO domain-containing protein n=1 Tax=Pholiota conissans TaxID=109636 RepID=A0A9P5Z4R7_9AGAR|nr:CRAL/TRIO domain-containing protein [Pholiota conissans]